MVNTWQEDLHWYETHQTTPQIGFNPDGMCLKICRTSRDIPAQQPTAKAAQDATPQAHRFFKVRDLRRGMKLFFDDPHDSNTAGHVVTMIGRVDGFNWDSLDDILVETNSVVSGQIVIVRASYFKEHWGDSFQFGTDYLNGVEFDYYRKEKPDKGPKPDHSPRVDNFRESGNEWNVNILDRAVKNGRLDIAPKVKAIEDAVDGIPAGTKDERVVEFRETFKKKRVLKMSLLNEVAASGGFPKVTAQRDELRKIIKSVLRH